MEKKGLEFVYQLAVLHIDDLKLLPLHFSLVISLYYQMTPLHVAGEKGRYRIVDSLKVSGAEINAEDNDGVGILNHI